MTPLSLPEQQVLFSRARPMSRSGLCMRCCACLRIDSSPANFDAGWYQFFHTEPLLERFQAKDWYERRVFRMVYQRLLPLVFEVCTCVHVLIYACVFADVDIFVCVHLRTYVFMKVAGHTDDGTYYDQWDSIIIFISIASRPHQITLSATTIPSLSVVLAHANVVPTTRSSREIK